MQEETFWIIAVHPVNGVLVKKLEFTSEDEEFLEDEEGWDSFKYYVHYYVKDELDSFEQLFYSAVAVKDAERLDIIKSLSDE